MAQGCALVYSNARGIGARRSTAERDGFREKSSKSNACSRFLLVPGPAGRQTAEIGTRSASLPHIMCILAFRKQLGCLAVRNRAQRTPPHGAARCRVQICSHARYEPEGGMS